MNAQLKESQSLLPVESINAVELFTGGGLDDLIAVDNCAVTPLRPEETPQDYRADMAPTAEYDADRHNGADRGAALDGRSMS